MIIYGTDSHKILQGDALNIMETSIDDESIDLIFADPPYNIGKNFAGCLDKWDTDDHYLDWCYRWLELCIKKLKPTGSFYVMTSTQFMPYFDIFLRDALSFKLLTRLIASDIYVAGTAT